MLGDVLHPEGPEGLRSVLDDDSPGVRTVSAVVLDHLGQSLTRLHLGLRVRPGDENFVLSVGAQLGDDGPEVLADVRQRLRLGVITSDKTGGYLWTGELKVTELPELVTTH